MVHSRMIDFDRDRPAPKLIPIDKPGENQYLVYRQFGVVPNDIVCLHDYLAIVIANSLRTLIAHTHLAHDDEALERVACYLEFASIDVHEPIYENVDWSNDREFVFGDPDWLSFEGRPGFEEYAQKTDIAEYWQQEYARQALVWLSENWFGLWD